MEPVVAEVISVHKPIADDTKKTGKFSFPVVWQFKLIFLRGILIQGQLVIENEYTGQSLEPVAA